MWVKQLRMKCSSIPGHWSEVYIQEEQTWKSKVSPCRDQSQKLKFNIFAIETFYPIRKEEDNDKDKDLEASTSCSVIEEETANGTTAEAKSAANQTEPSTPEKLPVGTKIKQVLGVVSLFVAIICFCFLYLLENSKKFMPLSFEFLCSGYSSVSWK